MVKLFYDMPLASFEPNGLDKSGGVIYALYSADHKKISCTKKSAYTERKKMIA